jgi:DNA helicase-2/ATP-dependent DNA helicase PcrA
MPKRAVPFKNVIPLEEIIADTFGVGTASKKVTGAYEKAVSERAEFEILLDMEEDEISKISTPEIAKAVMRVREGNVRIEGGYDGVFGKIHIFPEGHERTGKQKSLF